MKASGFARRQCKAELHNSLILVAVFGDRKLSEVRLESVSNLPHESSATDGSIEIDEGFRRPGLRSYPAQPTACGNLAHCIRWPSGQIMQTPFEIIPGYFDSAGPQGLNLTMPVELQNFADESIG
ncbi:MAG: hypothetical protein ACRESZ_07125 [Methylococcales bacterium]